MDEFQAVHPQRLFCSRLSYQTGSSSNFPVLPDCFSIFTIIFPKSCWSQGRLECHEDGRLAAVLSVSRCHMETASVAKVDFLKRSLAWIENIFCPSFWLRTLTWNLLIGLGMYETPLFLAHEEESGGRSVPTTPLQVAAPGKPWDCL